MCIRDRTSCVILEARYQLVDVLCDSWDQVPACWLVVWFLRPGTSLLTCCVDLWDQVPACWRVVWLLSPGTSLLTCCVIIEARYQLFDLLCDYWDQVPAFWNFVWFLMLGKWKERKSIYVAPFILCSLKALRHVSHSFTCKLHHACLSFVSVHQMAPP